MSSISIQTTQNVAIEYQLASLGDRIIAYFIDLVIVIAYIFTMSLVLGLTFNQSSSEIGVAILVLMLFLPLMFYHLLFEVFMDGRSPGKAAMKIKVVRLDGGQPELGSYLLRWIMRLIDISMFSGIVAIIAILTSEKGQRLGDMAAGTTVIKLKPNVELDQTIFEKVADDYEPTLPKVVQLSDDDIGTIREVLDLKLDDLDRQAEIVQKTVLGIQKKMDVTSELPPRKFLETVIKDYNHYSRLT